MDKNDAVCKHLIGKEEPNTRMFPLIVIDGVQQIAMSK